MRPRLHPLPGPRDDHVSVDDLEQWAERLARLVLHATALADRYEQTNSRTSRASQAALSRVARLREAAASGRDALADLPLGGRPGAALAAAVEVSRGLRDAVAKRMEIAQAQGYLMHRHRTDAGTALGMLRAAASDRDVTLSRAARDVLESGSATGPPGD